MRFAIASRIFEPEPSAASFRLAALAAALARAGYDTEVLTVSAPKQFSAGRPPVRSYRVKRFPVLRDRTGYVRGYLQYLSFDVPLFFRLLFGRQRDFVVVEPPPTTGFFARLAAWVRRTPYAYFAADIWSDATAQTGAHGWVVRVVLWLERFALRGAHTVLSVNDGVTARLGQLGVSSSNVVTVGNGVDTSVFSRAEGKSAVATPLADPYVLYSGTASEWQGAAVFVDAFRSVLARYPEAKLVFLGHGSDWPALRERAARLPAGAVEFIPTVPPEEAAEYLRGAVVSLASIRPDAGYDFAFPTKVFASFACGTPVVYAGVGGVPAYLRAHGGTVRLGESVEYDEGRVASALIAALAQPPTEEERDSLAAWAGQHVSLQAVAEKAVGSIAARLEGK